nr:ABC transporter permease [uncultured Flavobacterium sp.]
MMLKKIINSFALIFETAKKEKELIQKDSAVIEIYILFVALVYFFYTFVYSPEIFTNLPVAYVDNDQTTISHQIKRMLNETESLEITAEPTSLDEGRKLFEEGKVNGIILIPKNFSKELQKNGGNASIAIYSDASYMLYYDKTLQAVTNSLGAFTGALQLKQTMMSGVPMKQAEASSKPFNIIANPLYNLEEGYAIFLIPVVLIIALQTLQLTGMGVLYGTMRENDTFTTHFAMAKQRFGYFFMTIGRALPYLVISMLLLLLGILVVFHIFTIPQRGNLFEVIVFLIPVVLAITFLGQSLMNIFRNREDTIMLLTVFSIPALMMGGVSYPIVAFPLWIKVMGFFFPSTIGVKGFISLSQAGASLVEIRETFIQMWIICIFYFVLAVWTNRRFLYGLVPSKIPAKSEELDTEEDLSKISNSEDKN